MASLRVLLCLSAFVFGCSTLSRDHIAWDEDLDTHIAWDEDLDTHIAWDEDLDTDIAWPTWDEDLDTDIAWPTWDEDLDTDIAWPWDEDLDTHIAWDEDLDTMCRWVRKDQDQELRVILRNSTLESIIDNIRLDVSDFTQLRDWGPLHPDTTDVAYLVVGPSIADEIQDLLHKYGVYFQVRMRDLRQLIQEHLCVNQQLAEEDKAGEFNFARYHPYDEILQYLTDTAGRYPNLATLVDVANTSEGRSVVALKIGVPKKTPKRAVWIDAGIHAREWIAPATAVYFIQQLVTRYGRDQTVTDLLEKLDWYVVPVVNVDGYIYTWSDTERNERKRAVFLGGRPYFWPYPESRMWRKSTSVYSNRCEDMKADPAFSSCTCTERGMGQNCSCDCNCTETQDRTPIRHYQCTCLGVDLNRNWDVQWKPFCRTCYYCHDEYRGPFPLSEPETKGISDFILQRRGEIQAYLTLHSYSQRWLYPYGYNSTKIPPDHEDHVKLAEIAIAAIKRVHGKQYKHGRLSDFYYANLSGTSLDWAYEKAGIVHSYAIELWSQSYWEYNMFDLPPNQIVPTAQEMFPAFIQVGLYVWDGPNYEYVPYPTSGVGSTGRLRDFTVYQLLLTVPLMHILKCT